MGKRSRAFLLAALLGCCAGLLVYLGVIVGRSTAPAPETDLHVMLHRAVPLDDNELAVLGAKEQAFQARRTQIEDRLRVGNAALAKAIARSPQWSPDVESAMRQVEAAAASLQRETLIHVFEMRDGLKVEHREAYDKVLLEALRRGAP
ncbi:MAG: periplasmic heavy metal sensor [Rubrivivax sp.]